MRTPVTSPDLDRPAHGSREWWTGTWLTVLLVVAGWVTASEWGFADPPLDLQHANQARRALAQDRDLAAFNLGVEVEDRVATLWGTLPGDGLRRRAIELLKTLPEFRAVRSDIMIDPEHKPVVVPVSPSRFGPDEAPPDQPVPTGSLMKGMPKRDPQPLTWQYAPGQRPREEAPKEVLASPATSGQMVVLAVDLSLDQAILVIRQGDKRFAALRHNVRGRAIYLSGTVTTWEDAMDLARAVSRLPGVERVVLAQVRTSSTSP